MFCIIRLLNINIIIMGLIIDFRRRDQNMFFIQFYFICIIRFVVFFLKKKIVEDNFLVGFKDFFYWIKIFENFGVKLKGIEFLEKFVFKYIWFKC